MKECCKKEKEVITDTKTSERQVRIRLKDQGTLVLNVSWAHPTHVVAQCLAAIQPKTNELKKFTSKSSEIVQSAANAVTAARKDATQDLSNDLRALDTMVQALRKGAEQALERNFMIAAGVSSRTRFKGASPSSS